VEDLIPILVFLFFIIAPLIEKILKGGKQAPPTPPPRQRPVPRQREELPEPQSYQRRSETVAESDSETAGTAGSAAEMLPEDLWAILTGEAPPSRTPGQGIPPERTPGPVAMPDEPARRPAPVEARSPLPTAKRPQRPPRPLREPLPSQQRKQPGPLPDRDRTAVGEERFGVRAEPVGDRPVRPDYTLEDYRRPVTVHEEPVIISMETMPEHDEVRHTKFHDRLAALAAPSVVDRGKARVDVGLHDPAALRRAIIVSEVLGKPKGLE
jgi:hypothetical protein